MERDEERCDRLPPLTGHRIGITADRRAEEQGELLRRLGAEVTYGPVMRTLPLGDTATLRVATELLLADPPTMVLLTTGIGVRGWIGAAETWGMADELVDMLSAAPVYARGPKAYAAAVQAGIPVWRREPTERLGTMVDNLTARSLSGSHLALQLYGNDAPNAVKALEAAGARVTPVSIYRWDAPLDDTAARRLVRDAIDGHVAAVTFTSPAATARMCHIAQGDGLLDDLLSAFDRRVAAACVGPATAEAAKQAGIRVACAPDVGRLGLLVRALTATLSPKHIHLLAAGQEVIVQGGIVDSGARRVHLADRERQVLGALARRPGAVIARSTIEQEVWGSSDEDGALSAVLTRLRRHLAPTGLTITTRERRGYQLIADRQPCPAGSAPGAVLTAQQGP